MSAFWTFAPPEKYASFAIFPPIYQDGREASEEESDASDEDEKKEKHSFLSTMSISMAGFEDTFLEKWYDIDTRSYLQEYTFHTESIYRIIES
jgi:hypothetical protein